jgi:hypothetical protein
VSGPARPSPQSAQAERGLALGLLDALTGLSQRHALDRLIRGRAWIALIAFALIGIVTLQLLVLTLNANIGRSLAHETLLQRKNAALSIENSELAGGERIESQAARLGMELVPEGALLFLRADPRADLSRAGAALSAPPHDPGAATSEGAGAATSEGAGGATSEGAGAAPASTSAAAATSPAEQAPARAQPSEATASSSGEASSTTGASGAAGTPAGGAGAAAPGEAGGTQASGAG